MNISTKSSTFEHTVEAGDVAPARSDAERHRRWATGLAVLLGALLVLPLVVALVVLRHPRWYPLLDMAQTEIRVRDVASDHPPLIGLAGRIGVYGPDGGSHPGPVSFWVLWPFYQLFGASSWALQGATVVLNTIAVGLALWIAQRRGGMVLVIGVAVVLALLMRGYGASLLTLAWNPYLPLLWWFVFLLAIWSLVLDDAVMIPVAVFAGTFCMQTHVSYVGLVSGLGLGAAALLTYRAVRRRRAGAPRGPLGRYAIAGGALVALLWVAPVIDQIVHTPGNLDTLWDYFTDPPEDPIGYREGGELLLRQLDPWRLLTHSLAADIQPGDVKGSLIAGLLLLGVWAGAAILALRFRRRPLVSLHAVIAVALALGVFSAARIFGFRFYYLLLWAWGLTALMLLAIGWTAAAAVQARLAADDHDRLTKVGSIALAGVTVVIVGAFAFTAAGTDVQAPRQNTSLGAIVRPTADALEALERDGVRGPFFLTWFPDGWTIGAQGYGLLNELTRRDFAVRAHIANRPGSTRYYVMDPEDATIEIHVATGRDIGRWQTDPRYEEIVYFDPRSAEERGEFERLRVRVMQDLRDAGLGQLVDQVDDSLFTIGIDVRVPESTRELTARMLDLGMPTAVFIGPPSGSA